MYVSVPSGAVVAGHSEGWKALPPGAPAAFKDLLHTAASQVSLPTSAPSRKAEQSVPVARPVEPESSSLGGTPKAAKRSKAGESMSVPANKAPSVFSGVLPVPIGCLQLPVPGPGSSFVGFVATTNSTNVEAGQGIPLGTDTPPSTCLSDASDQHAPGLQEPQAGIADVAMANLQDLRQISGGSLGAEAPNSDAELLARSNSAQPDIAHPAQVTGVEVTPAPRSHSPDAAPTENASGPGVRAAQGRGPEAPGTSALKVSHTRAISPEVTVPSKLDLTGANPGQPNDRGQSLAIVAPSGPPGWAQSNMVPSAASPQKAELAPSSRASSPEGAQDHQKGANPDNNAAQVSAPSASQKTGAALNQTDARGPLSSSMLPLNSLGSATNMAPSSRGQIQVPVQGNAKSLGPDGDTTRSDDSGKLDQGEKSAALVSTISSARLTQKVSQSEMRVDLRSEDFGQISVHSTLGKGSVSTQITLENTQLGSTLATHVRELEQRLDRDHGLRASVSIDTRSGGRSPSDDPGGSDHKGQRQPGSHKPLPSPAATKPAGHAHRISTWHPAAIPDSQRIDVRI